MSASLERALAGGREFYATQGANVGDLDLSWVVRDTPASQPSTFRHQGNLPPLPLPSLEDTIERFLKTVRPFARDEAAMARVEEKARVFLGSQDAARRQRRLATLASVESRGRRF